MRTTIDSDLVSHYFLPALLLKWNLIAGALYGMIKTIFVCISFFVVPHMVSIDTIPQWLVIVGVYEFLVAIGVLCVAIPPFVNGTGFTKVGSILFIIFLGVLAIEFIICSSIVILALHPFRNKTF